MIQNIKEALKNYFEDESLINPIWTPGSETGYPERDVNWMKENLITKIEIVGSKDKISGWTNHTNLDKALGSCVIEINKNPEEDNGIISVEFNIKGKIIFIS